MTEDKRDDDFVWGASAIAKCINLESTKKAYRLLEAGHLPARRVGRTWVASRQKLKQHLSTPEKASA